MIAAIRAFLRRHLELELTYQQTLHQIRTTDNDTKETLP